MSINTVLGPIEGAELGRTLMHEHVYTLYSDLHLDYPYDEAAQDDEAVRRLLALKASGFDAFLDLTIIGLGRSTKRIIPIARRAGFHIVASTGIYTFRDLPSHFRTGTRFVGPDFIADFLTREIVEGIGDSGVKAGAIKFAVDQPGVTPDLDLLIRQSAKAQVRTGVPISTHTHAPSRQGLEQQRILREEGVDLGRVVIGHSGDSTDFDYLERLIAAGSYLGMDRFGDPNSGLPVADRVDVVAELCRRGYADRMVLSHDTNTFSDNTVDVARSRPEFAEWNYQTIPDTVLPALAERGVSQADIDTMTVANPAAILSVG